MGGRRWHRFGSAYYSYGLPIWRGLVWGFLLIVTFLSWPMEPTSFPKSLPFSHYRWPEFIPVPVPLAPPPREDPLPLMAGTCRVALTFDDGPDPQWTPKILEILAAQQIRATFFVVGQCVQRVRVHHNLLALLVAHGQTIGNHSYTHPNLRRLYQRPGWSAVAAELAGTSWEIAQATGTEPRYFRPPYGVLPYKGSEREILAQHHLQTVLWQIDTEDWQARRPETIVQRVARYLQAHRKKIAQQGHAAIILMHDGGGNRSATVRALPTVLALLRAENCAIVPLQHLPAAVLFPQRPLPQDTAGSPLP